MPSSKERLLFTVNRYLEVLEKMLGEWTIVSWSEVIDMIVDFEKGYVE